MMGFDFPSIQQVIFVLITSTLVKFMFRRLFGGSRKKEVELHKKDWKKDVVYLYQFHRCPTLPNLSPFCLKVETWLRMQAIEYEVIPSMMMRSKEGLLPFVELNGEQLADSQLIIQKLSRHFGKKDSLSAEQQAVARAVDRMLEGSLFYGLIVFKMIEHMPEFLASSGLPPYLPQFLIDIMAVLFRSQIKERMYQQGMYRHERADIVEIMRLDLQSISTLLADKPFLFGDQPTTTDCTMFGILGCSYFLPYDYNFKQIVHKDMTNIRDYLQRVKERLYPDWDVLTAKKN